MKKNLLIILSLIIISCSSSEIIGNHKYKTNTKKINIGEYDGLILTYKQYSSKGIDTFSTIIKAQKIGFESKKDPLFVFGNYTIKSINDKTYILTKEINMNGYENFTNTDSIIRVYQQFNKGEIKLNRVIKYRNGKENILK